MKRKCNRCNQEKDLSEFQFRKDNKYDCYCTSCRKEYQHEAYMKRRKLQIQKNSEYRRKNPTKDWFQKLKLKLKCSKCEENHPACLEFHHIDPSQKSFTISSMIRKLPKEDILKEIEKCQVLCANCHRKEHF